MGILLDSGNKGTLAELLCAVKRRKGRFSLILLPASKRNFKASAQLHHSFFTMVSDSLL
jgi:hypothetical protein